MSRKVFFILVCVLVVPVTAQVDYQMLTVTESGRYYKYRLDVSNWEPGEDFIHIRAYYIPWEGEDSLDYEMRMGKLTVNGEVVGVDLVEIPYESLNGKENIVTVQTDPSFVENLKEFPSLVAISYVGYQDEADLQGLKDLPNLRALDLAYTKISDEGLEHIGALTELRVLNLSYTEISDRGLAYLTSLENLHTLDLENTEITDSGLAYLDDLDNLRSLNLFLTPTSQEGLTLRGGRAGITDEGIKALAETSNLFELSVHGSPITDAGVVYLAEMDNLESLDLRATNITDEAVSTLVTLPNLRSLDIQGSGITRDGVMRLHHALPECEINY